MPYRFLNRFKRITYSTDFLPEIDGLRFLAIFSVVVIMHISGYLDEKFYGDKLIGQDYWKSFTIEGGNGVPLFFIISGFILSLPFAKWRLESGKAVRLKQYYIRRVMRLEPPYLIALILLFIGHVLVVNRYGFQELLPHFLASAVYLHTPIYGNFSPVMPVSWSLEVEVQFYILAPLFSMIYLVRKPVVRRVLLLLVILFSAVFWFDNWKAVHVFKYLHYFFSGLLLADLYCSKIKLLPHEMGGAIAGIIFLLVFLFLPSLGSLPAYLLKTASMILLVHLALSNQMIRRLFSIPVLVIIGGMCYSIYLLHFAIVSATGQLMIKLGWASGNQAFFMLYVLLFSAIVLVVSSIYFFFIEKPFMRKGRLMAKSL